MIIYRIIIGGGGVYAGVLVVLSTGSLGIFWHNYRLKKILFLKDSLKGEFYFFGLIIHIDMLLCMFACPKDQIFVYGKPLIARGIHMDIAECKSARKCFLNISAQYQGTELGLAISKRLVELTGGK